MILLIYKIPYFKSLNERYICPAKFYFVFSRASVAQLAEQLTLNQRVGSSSLPGRTLFKNPVNLKPPVFYNHI
jgi:hypothetical protein